MLSAACPVCGVVIQAATLAALVKAAGKHCKIRKPKVYPPVPETQPDTPWELILPGNPLSQNKTTYAHWSAYNKDKRRWAVVLEPLLRQYRGIRLPQSRWSILREYMSPAREYDYANLVGGCKPIPDLLIENFIIQDDSPQHFRCTYSQRKSDRVCTVITLLETQL